MAITQGTCTSFKTELLQAIHDFSVDEIKLALYTEDANLGPSTTEYSSTEEVPDSGDYLAGGITLANTTITTSGTTVFLDFSDVVITGTTITARGALIYNASKANKAVLVLDFGTNKSDTDSVFTIMFPSASADSAIFRLP